MRYRARDTGEIITAKRARARSPNVMAAADGRNWGPRTRDALGVDPVLPSDPPEVDTQRYTLDGSGVEQVDGQWHQKWAVTDRYDNLEAVKASLRSRVAREADQRASAGITVAGIPVRTDSASLTRLMGARASSSNRPRKFVDSEGHVHNLSRAQIDALFDGVDAYVEAVEERHAALVQEIEASSDPLAVKIGAGWPDGAA